MKFTIDKNTLANVASIVQRAASSKDALPALSCFFINAKQNELSFIATDLEIGIKKTITEVNVLEPGSVLVNARHFNDLIRYLPDTELTIAFDKDKAKLQVIYGKSATSLNVYDDADFPELPIAKTEELFNLPRRTLKEAVKKTSFAAAVNHFKVLFTGILFDLDQEGLKIVASDTHRLALIQRNDLKDFKQNRKLVIPARNVNELLRILDDSDEVIHIGLAENNMVFYQPEEGFYFLSRLIEGEYPNYNNVIPKNFITELLIDTNDLANSLDRAALMPADPKSIKHVEMDIQGDEVIITAFSEKMGEMKEILDVISVEGENNLRVVFNTRYLQEAIKILQAETDKVSIQLTGPTSPSILKNPADDNYTYVLVPLRTG